SEYDPDSKHEQRGSGGHCHPGIRPHGIQTTHAECVTDKPEETERTTDQAHPVRGGTTGAVIDMERYDASGDEEYSDQRIERHPTWWTPRRADELITGHQQIQTQIA